MLVDGGFLAMLLSSCVAASFLFEDEAVFSEYGFVGELIGLRSCVWAVRTRLGLIMDTECVVWKRP